MFRIEGLKALLAATAATGLSLTLAFVAWGAPLKAAHLVVMKAADAPAELTKMARDVFKDEFWTAPNACAVREFHKADPVCPATWRRASFEKDVAKGEADLNDDGIPELFFVAVLGTATCGTDGCDFIVVQRQGTGWRVILDDKAAIRMRPGRGTDDPYIRILDQTVMGYHLICSGLLYVWDGARYDGVYRTKEDSEVGNAVTCD